MAAHLPDLDDGFERLFIEGELPGAAFQWSGVSERDGETLHVRAVDVFEVDDGRITEVHGHHPAGRVRPGLTAAQAIPNSPPM